jgi:hypothetical protein
MKTKFRNYKSLALTSLLTFGAAWLLTVSGAEPHKGGTDILHLSLSQSLTNDGVTSDVNGSVRLKFNEQGHSTVQSLELNVSSLDSTIPQYLLLASTVDDPVLKPVAVFESDANGVAKIRYKSVVTGNGKVHSPGKGKTPLPAQLDPLSDVRQLVVAKTDGVTTQELATATLENPEHLNYLVKRDISTNDIPASLRIQANDQRGQFRLTAENLTASTDYWLVLNGPVADGGTEQVFTTDEKGKLAVRFTIENPLDAFALRKIQVRNLSEVGLIEPALSASLVLEVSLP